MTTEEMLLETWRTLDESRKNQVFQFMKLLTKTSNLDIDNHQLSPLEKVQQWEKWAKSHQKRGISLPDEALHRDSMYED